MEGLQSLKKQCFFNFDRTLEGKFYPFEEYIKLLECVQRISKDDSLAYKIGWHRARTLLLAKGVKNYGLEIFERVASAWEGFNNFGDISIKKHDELKISLLIAHYESHPLFCARMQGFIEGLLSASSIDSWSVKEVNCVCDGKDVCEFLIDMT